MIDRMPRLNILRPHRRSQHQNADTTPAPPPPATPATVTSSQASPVAAAPPPKQQQQPPLASVKSESGTTSTAPRTVSSLPPLDIGSPGLGSIGQWLHEPSSATSATPAPSSTAFSRTSTPWTNITAPTPAPSADKAKQSEVPIVREPVPRPKAPSQPPDRKSRQPALRLASAPPGVSPSQHHEQQHHHHHHAQKKDTKLGRLNPMTLLRRRSSQNQLQKAKEKDKDPIPDVDFNPGIIYGTRHPDWSSHPAKGDGRALSPVLIGKVSTEVQRKSFDGRSGSASPVFRREHARKQSGGLPIPLRAPPSPPMSPPPQLPVPDKPDEQPEPIKIDADLAGDPYEEVVKDRVPPQLAERSSSPLSFEELQIDNEGELHLSPEERDHRRGVTLVDHPLALPHHAANNSSRFSFDESNAPSAAPSVKKQRPKEVVVVPDYDDDIDEYDDGFQFDMGEDDEDDGFERANEGLFEIQNMQMPMGSGTTMEEQYNALQAAVNALEIEKQQQQQQQQQQQNAMSIGVAVSGEEEGELLTMMPMPRPDEDIAPLRTSKTPQSDDSDVSLTNKPIEMAGRKRLEHIANPRNIDLSDDDLDFIQEDSGLAGYEDEEDNDDMYFDDGIISRVLPEWAEQQQQQQQPVDSGASGMAEINSQPLANGGIPNGLTPLLTPSTHPGVQSTFPDDPRRLSLATNTSFQPVSSGLVGEDGSLSPPLTEPHAFPPFLNPVGGGFYNPHNVSHQVLNNLALSSLNSQLTQLHLQQQQTQHSRHSAAFSDTDTPDFGGPQSPYQNPYPDFGLGNSPSNAFIADDYEADDDAIIAAANADALHADYDGFYGSEFGFYASNLEPNELGGFFGAVNAPPPELLRPPIRRPSLTPISERSESSYRNSMVFTPGAGQWGVGSIQGLAQLAAEEEAGGAAGTGGEGLGGAQGVKELELQLMRIRRSAWGGSQGSLRSGGSSPGGWVPGAGEEVATTPGWGTPPGMTPIVGTPGLAVGTTGYHHHHLLLQHQHQGQGRMSPGVTPGGGGGGGNPGNASPLSMSGIGMGMGVGMGMQGLNSPTTTATTMGMSPISPGAGSTGAAPASPASPAPPPGGPPGLRHPGSRAMLPTKDSFEDMEDGAAAAAGVKQQQSLQPKTTTVAT